MDPLTSTAASGLRASMESLDLLANNLANAQTTGFKSDSEFYGLYASSEAGEPGAYDPTQMPVIERNWTDYSQGNLRLTGKPTDLAISGTGFFTVDGPSGPLYTRNGAFKLNPAGRLVTQEGYALQGSDGKPIQLDPSQPLELTAQGDLTQSGNTVGNVQPVSFANASDLTKQGATYFRFGGAAASVGKGTGEVLQGKLEDSNAGDAQSVVRLVGVLRQFEMLQKAIGIGVEMNQKTIQEVAKSGA